MKRRGLPKYCSEFQDRYGKWRVRFRQNSQTLYFKSRVGTDAFAEEYRRYLAGETERDIGKDKVKPGSIAALIAKYYRSTDYAGLAQITKRNYRQIMERFKTEYGNNPVKKLERQHIKAIIAKRLETPSSANNLLSVIRLLIRFAIEEEWRKDDPTIGIKPIRIKSDGFQAWSEEDIRKFEDRHPVGTKARLAMALLLYTGQRRQDVVVMGRQHIRDGRIFVTQHKTQARLWISIHPELQTVLDQSPTSGLTFLTSTLDRPFATASFGNWFKFRCQEAGLDAELSTHGLRKAAAGRLANAGCTVHEIAAITGHKTLTEVARYTMAADQQRLADAAIGSLKVGRR